MPIEIFSRRRLRNGVCTVRGEVVEDRKDLISRPQQGRIEILDRFLLSIVPCKDDDDNNDECECWFIGRMDSFFFFLQQC